MDSAQKTGTRSRVVQISTLILSKRYSVVIALIAFAAFWAILGIPFVYDHLNLLEFRNAESRGELVIREYAEQMIRAEIEDAKMQLESESMPPGFLFEKELKDKKLIALDYVNQMRNAGSVKVGEFIGYSLMVTVLASVLIGLCTRFAQRYSIRVPLLSVIFMGALFAMQMWGLPHTNKKFHMVIGLLYASLLVLSDFLYTLDIGIDGARASDTGKLSSLQYKHRFWTVIFNIAAAAVLTITATVSFKVLDLFVQVFGESFVAMPLIGLSMTCGFAGIGGIIGIFRPIRRHLLDLERAMER